MTCGECWKPGHTDHYCVPNSYHVEVTVDGVKKNQLKYSGCKHWEIGKGCTCNECQNGICKFELFDQPIQK